PVDHGCGEKDLQLSLRSQRGRARMHMIRSVLSWSGSLIESDNQFKRWIGYLISSIGYLFCIVVGILAGYFLVSPVVGPLLDSIVRPGIVGVIVGLVLGALLGALLGLLWWLCDREARRLRALVSLLFGLLYSIPLSGEVHHHTVT